MNEQPNPKDLNAWMQSEVQDCLKTLNTDPPTYQYQCRVWSPDLPGSGSRRWGIRVSAENYAGFSDKPPNVQMFGGRIADHHVGWTRLITTVGVPEFLKCGSLGTAVIQTILEPDGTQDTYILDGGAQILVNSKDSLSNLHRLAPALNIRTVWGHLWKDWLNALLNPISQPPAYSYPIE